MKKVVRNVMRYYKKEREKGKGKYRKHRIRWEDDAFRRSITAYENEL